MAIFNNSELEHYFDLIKFAFLEANNKFKKADTLESKQIEKNSLFSASTELKYKAMNKLSNDLRKIADDIERINNYKIPIFKK